MVNPLNPLKRWRTRKGIGISKASKELGVSHWSIQNWEKGKYLPNWKSFTKLSQALDTSFEELVEEWKDWYEGPRDE